MGIYVKDGGTWKPLQPSIKDGGTWKAPSVFVKDGGTWKSLTGFLFTSLTVGNDGSGSYGYDNFAAHYGSISQYAMSNGETVMGCRWNISAGSGVVGFFLYGTSRTNSDATFASITIGSVTLTRSAGTYTANDGFGDTLWQWGTNTSGYATSGSVVLGVN